MLTKEEKRELRSRLFRHLDGIVTAPTAFELSRKGVLDFLLSQKSVALSDITSHFKANEGYLNVALHIMASQGWLDADIDNEKDHIQYSINDNSAEAFKYVPLFEDVVNLLKFSEHFHRRKFEVEPFRKWSSIAKKYVNNYGLSPSEQKSPIVQQIFAHIEGIIVGPTVVALGMSGMFHKYFMETSFRPEEFHQDPDCFAEILDFFSELGWFSKNKHTYKFADKGLFFAKRASAYGVTVSYIPTMRHLDDLIFGDPYVLRPENHSGDELHVDRAMNVWGSGGAHSAYFKKVDEMLIEVFNAPLNEQPKGVLDMGCGNGAFLEHIFNVIESQTLRGEHLDEHPLFLVGADFNEAAIRISRANLIQADIWAKVLWGDIGRPDVLASQLKDDYNIDLEDLLNVRTFLDHNRIFETPPADLVPNLKSQSTGAFAHRGQRIDNNTVERSLVHHFTKWKPYVYKHGLLLIELHTISPSLIADNLGKTAATAYNATHGYSDQYIVEVDIFKKIAGTVGLDIAAKYHYIFPDSELATVSINLLKG